MLIDRRTFPYSIVYRDELNYSYYGGMSTLNIRPKVNNYSNNKLCICVEFIDTSQSPNVSWEVKGYALKKPQVAQRFLYMVVGNTANKVVGTAQYKDITDSANDMTPLGSSLYSLGFLSESEGWIKSSTNYLSGTKYETFYTKAVSMLNKPFAGGLIKDKAKEDYTDYDLVLDQIEQNHSQ